MPTKDPRVDAYIAKSAPFARPILKHLRKLVHQACPDCEETLKWGMPTFLHHGMLCGFGSFKEHATFGFWKYALLIDEKGSPGRATAEKAMGMFGCLKSVKDLPSDRVLLGLVRKAMKLNEDGIKVPKAKSKHPKPAITMPPALAAALSRNRKAKATFDAFSPSHRKEYMEWIGEAKSDVTRDRRLLMAIEWLEEGKPRNWKYMKK
ncbi:MAG: hypothetical protein FD129_750 [bacterium]|nr:MAG: hypothetical protein FD129_750 [bacterium]